MPTAIIMGAGISGITLAQRLASHFKVILFEKKPDIGGLCADSIDKETGILYPLYGPHIFHINDPEILDYISGFTDFNQYRHHVKTFYNGKAYDFPVNLATINSFYNKSFSPAEAESFLNKKIAQVFSDNPVNLEQKILNFTGADLYHAFFEDYTQKQWGRHPGELAPSIVSRIPIRFNYDSTYYKKAFHAMPSRGYGEMLAKMLDNANITLIRNTEADIDILKENPSSPVILTGPIDKFFEEKYGPLEYIGARYDLEYIEGEDFQGCAVMNFPERSVAHTRICEPSHFYPERGKDRTAGKTLIIRETPDRDASEKSYPIRNPESLARYNLYLNEKEKYPNLFLLGRLGEYRYYDMEDSIKSALKLADKIIGQYY